MPQEGIMRAFIRDNHLTKEILKTVKASEEYWLVDSKESFHGEFQTDWDGSKVFVFKDHRISSIKSIPVKFVKCEEHSMIPNTTMNFMYCVNCGEGLDEGLSKMPKEPSDLYS